MVLTKSAPIVSSDAGDAATRRRPSSMAVLRVVRIGRLSMLAMGPAVPRIRLEEAMETPNGVLVRRRFRLLNAKGMGLTIMLADITEEEFRVLELIEAERQEEITNRENGADCR